jgi:uncharacterized protein (DUF488 family)
LLNTYKPLKLPSKPISAQKRDRELWNSTRSKDEADFYTMGYSGRTISEFVNTLELVGVCSIVDIRFSPISLYKPEFSRVNLQHTLLQHELNYFHFPNLGIPRDIRSLAIDTQNRNVLWEWYDRYVVSNYINGNLDNFFNTLIHPVALLCTEISPVECHRHRLALALEKRGLKSYDL